MPDPENVGKQASLLHKNDMKKLKKEMRWKMHRSVKLSWFKVPVKVEQINEYLFSDTVQSQ